MRFIKDMQRKYRAAKYFSSFEEEAIYSQVAEELASGQMVSGLWTMALARSSGDEAKAKAKYLTLRADALKGEAAVLQEIKILELEEERVAAEKARAAREEELVLQRKKEEIAAQIRIDALKDSIFSYLSRRGYKVDATYKYGVLAYRVKEPAGGRTGWKSIDDLHGYAVERGFKNTKQQDT